MGSTSVHPWQGRLWRWSKEPDWMWYRHGTGRWERASEGSHSVLYVDLPLPGDLWVQGPWIIPSCRDAPGTHYLVNGVVPEPGGAAVVLYMESPSGKTHQLRMSGFVSEYQLVQRGDGG